MSLVDLGLVYRVEVEDGRAEVDLTLAYSGCPARDLITTDVENAVRSVEGIEDVVVSVVYSPTWDYGRITDRGRAALNEHGLAAPGDADRPDPDCH